MDPRTDANYWEGMGEGSQAEVTELMKALEAQEGVTDIANLTGGGALQPQSLETTLALLTFQEKHIKFFKDIGITKAFSTLEEFSIQDGYGSEGGFVGQMENPEEGDPDFRRSYAVVKYIRTLWKTADVLQYTRTITNTETVNVQAAMMRALRIAERNLFFGDSNMIPQAWDGLAKTIEANGSSDHVVDMRNATLSESVLRNGAELINNNYGSPTKLYVSPGVQTSLDQLIGITPNTARLNYDNMKGSGIFTLGHKADGMRTSFGDFTFEPDIFIARESWTIPKIKNPSVPGALIEGATSTKAPATPSIAVTIDAPTVAGSLWAASGSGGRIAGDYRYRVCAVNQYGKSAACAASGAQTVAASGALTVTITAGAGAYAATAYEVYGEVSPGSGEYLYIKTVTAAAAVYQDLNANIPGTGTAFLIDMTVAGELRTMALSQLAPMHKVEYAKIAPYRWGTVNFYAVPKFYAPLRYVEIKNISVSQNTVSQIIDL